jgi:hypothetical protein
MHNRAQRGVDERAVPASTLITVADSSRMPRRLSHSNLAVRSCGPYTTCACGTTAMRYDTTSHLRACAVYAPHCTARRADTVSRTYRLP